jgi:hypothetical protein
VSDSSTVWRGCTSGSICRCLRKFPLGIGVWDGEFIPQRAFPTVPTLAVTPTEALTYGQKVTLTATVTQTGSTTIPAGIVTFTEGGITLGTGTLNNSGVATLTTTALPAGIGTLVATYAGSSSSSTSGSSNIAVTMAKAPLAVTAANASRFAKPPEPPCSFRKGNCNLRSWAAFPHSSEVHC